MDSSAKRLLSCVVIGVAVGLFSLFVLESVVWIKHSPTVHRSKQLKQNMKKTQKIKPQNQQSIRHRKQQIAALISGYIRKYSGMHTNKDLMGLLMKFYDDLHYLKESLFVISENKITQIYLAENKKFLWKINQPSVTYFSRKYHLMDSCHDSVRIADAAVIKIDDKYCLQVIIHVINPQNTESSTDKLPLPCPLKTRFLELFELTYFKCYLILGFYECYSGGHQLMKFDLNKRKWSKINMIKYNNINNYQPFPDCTPNTVIGVSRSFMFDPETLKAMNCGKYQCLFANETCDNISVHDILLELKHGFRMSFGPNVWYYDTIDGLLRTLNDMHEKCEIKVFDSRKDWKEIGYFLMDNPFDKFCGRIKYTEYYRFEMLFVVDNVLYGLVGLRDQMGTNQRIPDHRCNNLIKYILCCCSCVNGDGGKWKIIQEIRIKGQISVLHSGCLAACES